MNNKTNYLLTFTTNFTGILISMLVGFISIPISLNYWKSERYSIWALVTSILIYLSVTNLGLNSAANVLIAKNSKFEDKIKIFKRALVFLILSVTLGLIIFLVVNYFNKDWIFILGKIPQNLKSETYYSCLVFGIFFFINMPFSLLGSVFNGFQKAYIENVFSIVQTIFTFLSLLLTIKLKGNLVTYAFCNGSTTVVLNLIKMAIFYKIIYKKVYFNSLCTDLKNYNNDTSYKHIFITGIRFFSVGMAAIIVWNTDNFVISNFIGLKEVAPFFVTFKMYTILFSLITIINSSIMPIIGKELAYNNFEWINSVYSKLFVIAETIGGLTWLGGLLFLRDIITLWSGKESYAGIVVVFALGGYSYLFSMVNLNSGILTAMNYIKGYEIMGWFEAVLNIGLSIFLIKYFSIGGVAIGTFLGSLLSPTWILPFWIVKRSNKRIKYNLSFVLKHFGFIILPLLMLGLIVQNYVSGIYGRVLIGILICIIYIVLSIIIIPKEKKNFFIKTFLSFFKKFDLLKCHTK